MEFESENNSLGEITLMWLKQASSLHVIFTVALNSLFSPQSISEDPHCASAHTVRCRDAWGHYVNSTERRAVLTDTQQQPHGSSFTQVAMSYREKDGCVDSPGDNAGRNVVQQVRHVCEQNHLGYGR